MFLALNNRVNTSDYLPSQNVASSRGKNIFLDLEKRDQKAKEKMEIVPLANQK